MILGEKVRYLRLVEGMLRGLGREMTQQELARTLKSELGKGLSQAYLSQIESGTRRHLSNASRMTLARFFKVHPGYLVDDPEGYHPELMSDLRAMNDSLDLWLMQGVEQFNRDSDLSQALMGIAMHRETRKCLLLLGAILDTPDLVDRLVEVLLPSLSDSSRKSTAERRSPGSRQ
jgi:transcriptional regulator with XRE-family HTH domain